MPEVNYFAVAVATVAAFAIGGLWYSPMLFANSWMQEQGFTPEDLAAARPSMGRMYGTALLASFLGALAMAAILIRPEHHSLTIGLKRGFAAGLCWAAMPFASSYVFEQRSLKLWMINAGYYVTQFTAMGAILGVMNK